MTSHYDGEYKKRLVKCLIATANFDTLLSALGKILKECDEEKAKIILDCIFPDEDDYEMSVVSCVDCGRHLGVYYGKDYLTRILPRCEECAIKTLESTYLTEKELKVWLGKKNGKSEEEIAKDRGEATRMSDKKLVKCAGCGKKLGYYSGEEIASRILCSKCVGKPTCEICGKTAVKEIETGRFNEDTGGTDFVKIWVCKEHLNYEMHP